MMSALGQKQTYAAQQAMSALPPIATAKADFRKPSCPLYPRKRTCALQTVMSALGQKRTHASVVSSKKSLLSITEIPGTVPGDFLLQRSAIITLLIMVDDTLCRATARRSNRRARCHPWRLDPAGSNCATCGPHSRNARPPHTPPHSGNQPLEDYPRDPRVRSLRCRNCCWSSFDR